MWRQEGLRHVDHEGPREVHADADGAAGDDGGGDAAILRGAGHGHQGRHFGIDFSFGYPSFLISCYAVHFYRLLLSFFYGLLGILVLLRF